jgi:N-acetylmuramoyl-L-alanine amidase
VTKYLFLLLLVIFTNFLNAASLSNKYFYAKKNYATAVLSSNTEKEIKYLKQLILYGTKLNKNISSYKKELFLLSKNKKYLSSKKTKKMKVKNIDKKYNISNVYTNKNQIIIEFKHKINKSYIKFKEYKKSSYYYDSFDIKGRYKDANPTKLSIKNVNKIIVSQYRYNTLRLSTRNKYNTKSIYIIDKNKLIIKLFPKKNNKKIIPKNTKKIKIINNTFTNKFINSKVIVIDAGHGGKDSGAVGPGRKYEKHAVLKITKYLYTELIKNGFKVYLTRNSDKYLKLTTRTKFANKKKADIFISIHANSVAKRNAKKAKGIETYFLSPARSERAKRVAAKENNSDIKRLNYSSKNIVLELLNRSKITASQKLAIDVQSHMLHNLKKYYKGSIVDKGVREGPFWVLVGTQMPSILVEIGYISHPDESKKIYSTLYQKRMAHGIFNGIVAYFTKNN